MDGVQGDALQPEPMSGEHVVGQGQVEDAPPADDIVSAGATEATDTETPTETVLDQTDSTETVPFDQRAFLEHGLTPLLNRINVGTTEQVGPDSAQRNSFVAQQREHIESIMSPCAMRSYDASRRDA